MKLEHHITLSAVISGVLFGIYQSWSLSVCSFISGVFIDVDHLIDYFGAYGLCIRPQEIMSYFYEEKHDKIILIFHGWEWLSGLFLLTVMSGFNPWVTGVMVGYSHHIISDFLYNRTTLISYSLIYRWKKGFISEVIFPRGRKYAP
jgi:hypothetical protein